MDPAEAVSELERVAILLDSTAAAIVIEDPVLDVAVEPMHKAADELRKSIQILREVWAD